MSRDHIRNFCIIAHIDHGKSTLADRLMDVCGLLNDRNRVAQFLDRMPIERERGITIKAQTVRMPYKASDGTVYEMNLIDTPGHVDFTYEVSRSLQACEGALLVVDAAQGVEAQTLANVYMAIDHDLAIVPVINKIDLPGADVERTTREIEEVIGLDCDHAVAVSAKTGLNVAAVLDAIVKFVPPPKGNPDGPLRALIFDSWFDSYLGVIVLVRVIDGRIVPGMRLRFVATDKVHDVQRVGTFSPEITDHPALETGEVGWVVSGVKVIGEARVGDTLTEADRPAPALPGFKTVQPMVFSGLYPVDSADYDQLRDALEKLRLNDYSFTFEPETSLALGFGFRCGFLGLLHMEIVQERLEQEFSVSLITTAPTVVYRVHTTAGKTIELENPSKLPDPSDIDHIDEPIIHARVHVPTEFIGPVLALCEARRGSQRSLEVHGTRAMVEYELPMNEIVLDFYDKLKSATRGYASLDYELAGYRESKLVRLDLLVNGDPVDALSVIVHHTTSRERGLAICERLKDVIPRQQYDVAIQAAIGRKIIARTTVKAFRKDVTAKCYGGDITRKRKLLEKQKAGKKRMKSIGAVEIPQEAFLSVLKTGED